MPQRVKVTPLEYLRFRFKGEDTIKRKVAAQELDVHTNTINRMTLDGRLPYLDNGRDKPIVLAKLEGET